ncbi:hypothetical protein GSI_05122 [Ganoderma sinense ZZ0214-1]|uniref:DUF6534 domain-containing protein n=1 Tax=Ganoderma sinense ZZ0214-1 TaxID=1077348 RepID=A0A2G8SF78_9APHY|nr:hypothetical protein GSI_05122 [Ganoderma sinense ZZ0214-1]
MSTPKLAHTTIALNDTLGASFIGHTVATVLYGITTLQTFLYYRYNMKDPLILRVSVAGLWILDSLHVGLITGAMYWYCITNFSNLVAIQRPIWPITTMIIVSNLSNSIIRGIFCHRLYLLGHRSLWLPAIIGVLSVFIFVDAGYFSIKLFSIDSFEQITEFSWGLYAGLSVEAAVDLVVAIAQVILLRKFETGIRSTDSSIRVLMQYSINTGLLTSFCAIGAVVSFAAAPRKFIYFAFYFVLGKMYVNSLLATLNARGSILGTRGPRRRRAAAEDKEVAFPTAGATTDTGRNGRLTTFDASLHGAGIEFTTVISTPPFVSDSIVQVTKGKMGSSSDMSKSYSTV